MAGGPELYVVCKTCGEQVSPYITECPYCGNRLRKRAPKLDKGGTPKAPRGAKKVKPPREPRLGRLRAGEMPGIRAEGRPATTIATVVLSVALSLLVQASIVDLFDVIVGGTDEQPWRAVSTLFVYLSSGYEVVTLGAIFLFGWLLERRHGHWAPALVFLLGGAGAVAAVMAIDPGTAVVGGLPAAMALMGAWVVRDLRARRAGQESESDLLGVAAIACVLGLMPLAVAEANALAAFFGGVVGLVLGLLLARMPER